MAGGHYIDGQWVEGDGKPFVSIDPATGDKVWTGREATTQEVDQAIRAARAAQEQWFLRPIAERIELLKRFSDQLRAKQDPLATTIARDTGKTLWESRSEVDAMIGKIPISIEAYNDRCRSRQVDVLGGGSATRFKPHGVVAVFGPFNFPGHLPNGHIVPALLAGNTVVFKPSEQAPLVAQHTLEFWHAAGLPQGVINLVQGARDTGVALSSHPGIDGLYFTGSVAVGQALHKLFAAHPEKILALELGGNNPLIVHKIADLDAAAYLTVLSAFITSGQRCSCARRLILPRGSEGDQLLDRLMSLMQKIRVGPYTDVPEPFIGPVISDHAAQNLLDAQLDLIRRGAMRLIAMEPMGGRLAMLRPGLIDVTSISDRPDVEHFGPLLQVIRVPDFDAAIAEANKTSYGLCAGLFSDDRAMYEKFYAKIRAGVVYWNRQTTGASSALPFGGIGKSGNHRPSAYFAADYCAYPVATMEFEKLQMPAKRMPGIA